MSDSRIQQLLKLPPGDRTNIVLYELLEPTLLGYWSFLEPKHKGIELADSLVWWNDVVILFEAKTRGKKEKSSQAWIRERLSKSIDQLNERVQMLKGGEVNELRNKWRGVIKWNPTLVKDYYGVVIMNHSSDSYEPRQIASEAFKKAAIPIQVFSLMDFSQLLRFVNTAWDFIVYYELRAKYGRHNKCLVHQEFETYQGILSYYDNLLSEDGVSVEDAKKEQAFLLKISNAILRSKIAKDEGYNALASSLIVDLALGSLARLADPDKSGKRVGGPDHDYFVKSMGAIAELSRQRRSIYGDIWVKAAQKALDTDCSSYKLSYSPSRNRSYVFAAFDHKGKYKEGNLVSHAREAMKTHGTTSCLSLGATANNIIHTFNYFIAWAKDEKDIAISDNEIIDTTAVFIDSGV